MDVRLELHAAVARGAIISRRVGSSPGSGASGAVEPVEPHVRRGDDARAELLRDLRETVDALSLAREARSAVADVSGRLRGLQDIVEALGDLEEPSDEQVEELQAFLDEGIESLDRFVGAARFAGRALLDGALEGPGALRVDAADLRLAVPGFEPAALGLEGAAVDDPRTVETLRAARERADAAQLDIETRIERLELARRRIEQKLDELARGRVPQDPEQLARDARSALLQDTARGDLVHGLLAGIDSAGLLARSSV